MEALQQINLKNIIHEFMNKHEQGIKTIHRLYLKNDNPLSIKAFITEVSEELNKGIITFNSKNYPMDELDPYLFYIVNAVGKKKNIVLDKTYDYLCPGCLFLGKENIIFHHKNFECELCFYEFKHAKENHWIKFFETFKVHNKSGFKCADCEKFIPQPLDNSTDIVCPYINCCFVGDSSLLKGMHHPSTRSKSVNILFNDSDKNNIVSSEASVLDKLQINEDLENKLSIINEVIDGIIYILPFKTQNLISKQKIFVCQAFKNLLDSEPVDMVNYLLNNSRSGGFQHKVFQEYIKILEESFPLFYQEKRKQCKIDSLLDDQLSLFEGISDFKGIVNENYVIKNNTQEFYIGGRKASYTKPYYIGKLLSIISEKNHKPIMDKVVNYSFSRIKMKDVAPGTEVIVSHLRVPPHYQMGGMTYVNRIRKHIVEKSRIILKNNE